MNTCGSGTLTVPDTVDVASLAATLRASLTFFNLGATKATSVREWLADDLCFEVEDSTAEDGQTAFQLYFNGEYTDIMGVGLRVLAQAGTTGECTFSGEQGAQWKAVLAAGSCHELVAMSFYPKDPDPEQPCVALNRSQVTALLALVAGDHTPALVGTIATLTDAIR